MTRRHRPRKLLFESCESRRLLATIDIFPSADTTLYENETGAVGNGSGQHFFAGRTNENSNSLRRGLVEFDLDSLPSGAVINNASLTLNVSLNQPGSAVGLHRVTTEWKQGASDANGAEGRGTAAQDRDATWVHSVFSTALWQSPGGDFIAAESASETIDGLGAVTWSGTKLTSDVNSWQLDPSSNFGWLLKGDESSLQTAHRFDSRENADPKLHPKLTIDFTVPNVAPTGIAVSDNRIPSGATGVFVGEVTVSDADSPDGHVFSVSDDRFQIESGTLSLVDGVLLDRNESSQVTLEITATDTGLKSLTQEFTFEILEVIAFENPVNRFDINADGSVSPLDALVLINFINSRSPDTSLPDTLSNPPRFLNPSGDDSVAAIDVLLIVNFINSNLAQGELLPDAWDRSLLDVTGELDSRSDYASIDPDVVLWDWTGRVQKSRTLA
jgi:hypothetical protein